MADIRSDFLRQIDVEGLSLKNLPNYVFLCGGKINPVDTTPTDTATIDRETHFLSLRDAILQHLSVKEKEFYQRIILAENFRDWLDDANISNLIDFETLLAGLAVAVILIVEGPGAYAELGAFSVIPEISPKLISIYNVKALSSRSFIEWGPIKYLEKHKRTIFPHEWGFDLVINKGEVEYKLVNDQDLTSLVEIIVSQVLSDVKIKTKSSSIFDLKNEAHICLLVADLIYIFSALKIREINDYLEEFFSIDLAERRLGEFLYSLERLKIIKKKSVGATYYLPGDINSGYIKYKFINSSGNIVSSSNEVKSSMIIHYMSHDQERKYALGLNGGGK